MPSVTVKAHHLVKSANLPARLVFVKQHDSKVQQDLGFPDPLRGKRQTENDSHKGSQGCKKERNFTSLCPRLYLEY